MHFPRRLAAFAAAALLVATASALHADTACRVIQYQFQPLPYDAVHELPGNAAPGKGVFEEGGPQVAIWLESVPVAPATRGQHLADLFVTNRTAQFGIGNRPGHWDFVSSPRMPYGARDNALPVWAYARGHSYPLLRMQDTYDDSFGFHESSSTTENFYCRPLQHREIVDALTCPTPIFNSDKGRFDPNGVTSLYPPRHDVAASMCHPPDELTACRMLADLDDVAAISGATPSPYTGVPYVGSWVVPASVPDGDYYVFIEVNKQFDNDAPTTCLPVPNCGPTASPPYKAGAFQSNPSPDCPSYAPLCDCNAHVCERHESFYDTRLLEYAMGGNFGQPSVVWSSRVTVLSDGVVLGLADNYTGYGDWDQARGNLFAPDSTISQTDGSGAGRLKRISDTDGTWRFKVVSRGSPDAAAPPPPVDGVSGAAPNGDQIRVCFNQSGIGNSPVAGYDIRYKLGAGMSDSDFAMAAAGPHVNPGQPGTLACFDMGQHEGIQAQRTFTIGIRAIGDCMKESELRSVSVTTPRQKFATIEGCFIATAAYGSDLEPDVLALRQFRDRFLLPRPLGRALVGLYYAASPPLARAIRHDDALRARVRTLLRPEVALCKAALLLSRP